MTSMSQPNRRLTQWVLRAAHGIGCVALLSACGEEGVSGAPDADVGLDGGDGDADGGPEIGLAGELTILDGGGLGHGWQAPVVFGQFPNGGPPIWHQEVLEAGSCRLVRYQAGFCERCDGVCQGQDVCRPWPIYRSAGTITIDGSAAGEMVLEPGYLNRYQTFGGLPDPLFEAIATIEVRASGAEID
jgi:hypothetical protein